MKTPHLSLSHLVPHQIQRETTVNDAFINNCIISRNVKVPPANPMEGDLYVVAEGATGAWENKTDQLTYFSQLWRFVEPHKGVTLWGHDEEALITWNGEVWRSTVKEAALEKVGQLGVNATADTTNRLVVSSEAALFTHAGHDTQMKLNKAGEADTVSQLFQSNYTSYAEWGLVGNYDFSLKVSPDGKAFIPAMSVSHKTAQVSFHQPVMTHTVVHKVVKVEIDEDGVVHIDLNKVCFYKIIVTKDVTGWDIIGEFPDMMAVEVVFFLYHQGDTPFSVGAPGKEVVLKEGEVKVWKGVVEFSGQRLDLGFFAF